jgi:hypothetical protein
MLVTTDGSILKSGTMFVPNLIEVPQLIQRSLNVSEVHRYVHLPLRKQRTPFIACALNTTTPLRSWVARYQNMRCSRETVCVGVFTLSSSCAPVDCFQASKYPLIATCNQTVISRGKNYDDMHGGTQITRHFRRCFFHKPFGIWDSRLVVQKGWDLDIVNTAVLRNNVRRPMCSKCEWSQTLAFGEVGGWFPKNNTRVFVYN